MKLIQAYVQGMITGCDKNIASFNTDTTFPRINEMNSRSVEIWQEKKKTCQDILNRIKEIETETIF